MIPVEAKRKHLNHEKDMPPKQENTRSADCRPSASVLPSCKDVGKVDMHGRKRAEVKKGEDRVKNKLQNSSAPPHKVLIDDL